MASDPANGGAELNEIAQLAEQLQQLQADRPGGG